MRFRNSPTPSPGRRRLLFVTASSPQIKAARRARVLNFQQITMPSLAALAPPDWDVVHVDEAVAPVDTSLPADLVGVTFHTPSAHHVCDMAARFRARGIPVMLGGPHVTLMPDEAQQHADFVFVGEAEETLVEFFDDFARGACSPRYVSTAAPSLDDAPMARKDLYHRRDFTAGRLFATRGCANNCEFCTHALRKEPVRFCSWHNRATANLHEIYLPLFGEGVKFRAAEADCRAKVVNPICERPRAALTHYLFHRPSPF